MNFFGIGLFEIAVVVIIAVIVLGPERFPQAAVQVARAIKFLRGYATSTTAQLREELGELTREYEDVRRELQEFRDTIKQDMSSIVDELDRVTSEAQPIIEPDGELPPKAPPAKGKKDAA